MEMDVQGRISNAFKLRNMKIYLDDIREAPEGWIRCPNAETFISTMKRVGIYATHISFDHDLHHEHYGRSQDAWLSNPSPDWLAAPTGYDACAAFIRFARENNLPHVILTCHSANTAGKRNIEELIHQYNQSFV